MLSNVCVVISAITIHRGITAQIESQCWSLGAPVMKKEVFVLEMPQTTEMENSPEIFR